MKKLNYIDLFAGAGGLSEGFIRAGFNPVAHVEMDSNACETLKTRLAYHFLKSGNKEKIYRQYLLGEITKQTLHDKLPKELFNSVINAEINETTLPEIFATIDKLIGKQKVDVIIGGPPCQAYSLVGRSRDPYRMKNDKRNFLFRYYAAFLKYYKPQYFVFENVTGLLTAKDYLNQMLELFQSKDVGYTVDYKILDASDFGVLQVRRRVIVIGKRNGSSFSYPDFGKTMNVWEVKKDLFEDLPFLNPGDGEPFAEYTRNNNEYLKRHFIRNGYDFVTQHEARPHNERDLKIYKIAIDKWLSKRERLHYNELPNKLKTHQKQDIFLDRFKVVNPTGFSHTVVAHIAKDGHYYIYPDPDQVRSISVREAARIQSFPDDYYFEGGRSAAFKQIGNAVPPLMAQGIAEAMYNKF